MEKPAFANRDVYDIMLNCWNAKPESRPLFGELERRLGSLLHESVKEVRQIPQPFEQFPRLSALILALR
jgi:Protein tyrosine and serine/threonine kinase